MTLFPSLATFGPTRQALHAYSHSLAVIPRAHLPAHPLWWHISLTISEQGLSTQPIPLADGSTLSLRMDLRQHAILVESSQGASAALSLTAGLSGSEMGDQLVTAVAKMGLPGNYLREKYADETPLQYDPAEATRYFELIVQVDRIFKAHMATLPDKRGEVHLWPHGFDVSVEWFGNRTITAEEHGQVQEFPSQINLGFYPGSEEAEPYFYSNPFPFAKDKYLDQPLPAGARWYTASWEGTMFPYAELVYTEDGETRLRTYAQAVFDIASPDLLV